MNKELFFISTVILLIFGIFSFVYALEPAPALGSGITTNTNFDYSDISAINDALTSDPNDLDFDKFNLGDLATPEEIWSGSVPEDKISLSNVEEIGDLNDARQKEISEIKELKDQWKTIVKKKNGLPEDYILEVKGEGIKHTNDGFEYGGKKYTLKSGADGKPVYPSGSKFEIRDGKVFYDSAGNKVTQSQIEEFGDGLYLETGKGLTIEAKTQYDSIDNPEALQTTITSKSDGSILTVNDPNNPGITHLAASPGGSYTSKLSDGQEYTFTNQGSENSYIEADVERNNALSDPYAVDSKGNSIPPRAIPVNRVDLLEDQVVIHSSAKGNVLFESNGYSVEVSRGDLAAVAVDKKTGLLHVNALQDNDNLLAFFDPLTGDYMALLGENGGVFVSSDKDFVIDENFDISTTASEEAIKFYNSEFGSNALFDVGPDVDIDSQNVQVKSTLTSLKDATSDLKPTGELLVKYETGNKNPNSPETLALAIEVGDQGATSFGPFQIPSSEKYPEAQDFIIRARQEGAGKHPWLSEFEGVSVSKGMDISSDSAFALAWRKAAYSESFNDFYKSQRDYVLTQNYNPYVEHLQTKGIDLASNKYTPALREYVLSVTNQYGHSLIERIPLNSKMTDLQIVNTISSYLSSKKFNEKISRFPKLVKNRVTPEAGEVRSLIKQQDTSNL